MSEKYYYMLGGKRVGPVSLAELKLLAARQELKRSDKLWIEGMETWQLAESISDIFAGLPPDVNPEFIPTFPSSETRFWYLEVLKKYAVFYGRARRQEYWMFFLINIIITVLLSIFEAVADENGYLINLYQLAVLCPWIAVGIRRMHDTGRTGWWLLVPFANLVFLAQDSQPGGNQYGANPKTGSSERLEPIPTVIVPSNNHGSAKEKMPVIRDLESQLRETIDLKEKGLITDIEFQQKRRKILDL